MIKVFIADDHAVVRDGVRHILERAGGFEVVAEAEDGTQVCGQLRRHRSDVIVLDLSMPGRSGLELIKQIRSEFPGVRILVLTMHAEEEYVRRAFRAGASGYLTKESAATELVAATGKVATGGTYVSQAIGETLATGLQGGTEQSPHLSLSDREMEVFRRLVLGESVSAIAADLCVSAKTVSTYKMRLMEKLGMPNEAALVRYAIRHGLFGDDATL